MSALERFVTAEADCWVGWGSTVSFPPIQAPGLPLALHLSSRPHSYESLVGDGGLKTTKVVSTKDEDFALSAGSLCVSIRTRTWKSFFSVPL